MSEVMNSNVNSNFNSNVENKKGSIGKAGSIVTAIVAWGFAVNILLNPTPAIAEWFNNDWTKFSEDFSKKYEKCWDSVKNKCAEVSDKFTFIWDQEVDIDFFDRNNIIWNNGNITLIDNWYTVIIKEDWSPVVKEAVFWKEVQKILKNEKWELLIKYNDWKTSKYKITKITNWMTSLEKIEDYKITFSVDWEHFYSLDKMNEKIKTLDLGWKEWKIINLDNENGEVYELFYNGKKIPWFLDANTKEVSLDKEGKLIIKDKTINWKMWEITIYQLSIDKNGNISKEKIKRKFVYKK